jgi:dihydrolipoamide dehydrogenase
MSAKGKRLCILGAGPGGIRAAFEGARLGFSVTLVERNLLGGVCLNCGCIPTKQYLNGTAAVALFRSAGAQKLLEGTITPNLRALKAKKDRFIKGTRRILEKQLREAGVRLIFGEGRVGGEGRLEVASGGEARECAWDTLVLATGSRPASFPGVVADHDCVLDSTDILELEDAPPDLLVVGGGAIGLEMADFFSRLDARVTLVEARARIAPSEDPEIGDILRKIHAGAGWKIHTGRTVASLSPHGGKALLRFADGEEILASKALLAVGRAPVSAWPGREKAGSAAGFRPAVDECLRLAPNVYAVGDVNGKSLLAHMAEDQARYAVAHAAGAHAAAYAPPPVPACIYGHMEIMRVGPSFDELRARPDIECSRSNLIANAIAQGHCATQGFVKVFWEKERVCGVSALGYGVSHLAGMAGVIVSQAWTARDVRRIIWAHPTPDEALEAALTAPREKVEH